MRNEKSVMACFYVRPAMVLALLGLAACGGGGGGGGDDDGVSTPPPITNLPANATTTLDGQSISADYEPDSITSVTAGPASTTLTTRDGQVVAVSLTAPNTNTNIAFDASNGDTIEQDASAVVATSSTGDAELALANGYQHQTFGVWIDGPPGGSGTVGAGSFGRIKTTTLPTGTTATYRGTSAGYLQQGTDRYLTRSDITVTTDFATTAAINSTNTQASSVNGSLGNSEDYDFTATGTVGVSGFTAPITKTDGTDLAGQADGQFYGPTAEEVGGTFALQGSDGQYLGAFGARQ